jgi:hypothetical protein
LDIDNIPNGIPPSIAPLLEPPASLATAWQNLGDRTRLVIQLAADTAAGDEAEFCVDLANRLWWVVTSPPFIPTPGVQTTGNTARFRTWLWALAISLKQHALVLAPRASRRVSSHRQTPTGRTQMHAAGYAQSGSLRPRRLELGVSRFRRKHTSSGT